MATNTGWGWPLGTATPSTQPFLLTGRVFCRGFDNGGIGIVEMLFRCNILAIVGGGPSPKYPPNKVRAVKLRRDRIVVALEHKVLVYNFADLKLVHQIETLANPRGLLALSSAADSTVLACPGLHTGQVRLELYDRRNTKFVSAHTNALCCLSLSLEGKRLVSASEKGTLVRVWNTADGQLLQVGQAAPGSSNGNGSVSGSSDSGLGATGSGNSGTDQIQRRGSATSLGGNQQLHPDGGSGGSSSGGGAAVGPHAASSGATSALQLPARTTSSLFSLVRGLVPSKALPKYFTSEWSFAQFRVPGEDASKALVVGFGPTPHTLIIITTSGSFYKVGTHTV
ncbi:hypothetical protein QJQ45_027976 [Haematococcus lacustris]|nr:hypothetical protein QJQ45_027976 [Haematococcus lacustris]